MTLNLKIASSPSPRNEIAGDEITTVRRAVQAKLESGALPRYGSVQLWGGAGTGLPCDACELPVEVNHAEITADLDSDEAQSTLRLHPHCFSIWQAERSK